MITIIDGKYNFPSIKKGNSFRSRQIQFTDIDGNSPTNSLASVGIRFRKDKKDGEVALYIYNGSGITIDDAANWIITIIKFDVEWDVADYYYDCDTEDSSSIKDTPLEGTLKITQNV